LFAGETVSAGVGLLFRVIAAGEAAASIADEDADTVAFMDINPLRRGHALAVSRRHYENLLEIEPDELSETFAAAQRLTARLKERLGAEDVVLWNAYGAAARQLVMHFHVHVIPTDGENPSLPRPDALAAEADIAAAAAALHRNT
jgi:histidine triad (HIT) family protein